MRLMPYPDLRLRLGAWGEGEVIVADLLASRRRCKLSKDLAAVLVMFMGGRSRDDGIRTIAEILDVSPAKADEAIALLTGSGLLASEVDLPKDEARTVRKAWENRGWTSAYDHYLATWNYPFVDYDRDGWSKDRERMTAYKQIDRDISVWRHDRCLGMKRTIQAFA